MQILSNTGGVFATTSYLVVDEAAKVAVLFDAPNDTTAPLLKTAADRGWDVVGLWLTHGHIDHIADHAVVTTAYPNAKVLLHPSDDRKLADPRSLFALPFQTPGRTPDGPLADGQRLTIGSCPIEVIHTPGHSPGHVAFHLPTERVLIGGDLILMGGVGRTDFPDCSYPDLQASIRRVMRLPPGTRLLPGHGHASLLSDELAENPYVREAMAAGR